MNIFAFDICPVKAAQYHCDKHVIKMILESAQLLSTAVQTKGIVDGELYKKTHINHPSAIWCRESRQNFEWLCNMSLELCNIYTSKSGKKHKSQRVIEIAQSYTYLFDVSKGLTPFSKAMDTKYVIDRYVPLKLSCKDLRQRSISQKHYLSVISYRNYMIADKMKQMDVKYTYNSKPEWIKFI